MLNLRKLRKNERGLTRERPTYRRRLFGRLVVGADDNGQVRCGIGEIA